MKCKHVLELIEAVPVDEWKPFQARQVKLHADSCAGCQSALLRAGQLDSVLKHLPDPDTPSGLTERILARTARLEERSVAPPRPLSRGSEATVMKNFGRNAFGWGTMFGGTAVALNAWLEMALADALPGGLISSKIDWWKAFVKMPDAFSMALLLSLGLFLYMAGLLISLRYSDLPETKNQ
jgi:hypothetical protein